MTSSVMTTSLSSSPDNRELCLVLKDAPQFFSFFHRELNVNWGRAYSWAALFITKHLRNALALADLTAQVCLRAKNLRLTLHWLNCPGFKPSPSTSFQSTANPCLLQGSPVGLLSCASIAPFSVSYTVIVSHVLMGLNEAFAAKIGIKRSGGILIEMNQQAPVCFSIHFSRKEKKMPGIMSWWCPSDYSKGTRKQLAEMLIQIGNEGSKFKWAWFNKSELI